MAGAVMMHRGFTWLRRNLAVFLTLAAFASAIITYIIISGNAAPLGMKPKRILTLMIINIGLLTLLIGYIGVRLFNMWTNLRTGTEGSQLQKRILVLFSVVTILPTLIVSIFSTLFFNLGIQTWFNDRVQTAVGESLVVAEAYLAEHKENIRADAIAMANDLNQVAALAITNPTEFNRFVATQSALRVLTETFVIQHNRIIAQGRLSFALAFEHIPQEMFERASKGEVVIITNEDDDKVRALIRLDAFNDGYLMVGRLIDSKVVNHMESAQGAVNEYSTLKTQLDRMQAIFSVVFVTLAVLLLLSSIRYGMAFAARLATPISNLALAAERVRGGDFSARVADTASKDEIGTLARTFNRMTEQLEAQRSDLIDANRRLDERRRFSEAVLSGVSAGVIAIDRDKRITLFNRSSIAILNSVNRTLEAGRHINDALPGIQEVLSQAEHLNNETAQGTITLTENNTTLTLHVRATVEQLGKEIEGYIVTFDDITLLTAAQRTAAWADVARRVAHEIKNPLTPIQLSTERLKRKYLKFITEDQDNFVKYIDTIAKHAADITKMVDEFVSFARMPTPVFTNEDLTGIIRKSVFSAQVANPSLDYEMEIPNAPVMLHCDERQMGQVMTNLLKNAAEAIESKLARNPDSGEKGQIKVSLICDKDTITINVDDNGTGFPPGELAKMLEPYVTTRTKGMGLGLSIVKKIVEDHKGKLDLANNSAGGARVTLSFLQQCDI